MVIRSLLGLKRKDTWALLISSLIGFFIVRSLPGQNWAVYASALLAYHLFLGWLVFTREKKDRPSHSIAAAIATHLGFVVLVVVLVAVLQQFPQLNLVRLVIAAIAVFERWFLLSPPAHRRKEEAAADLPGLQPDTTAHPAGLALSIAQPSAAALPQPMLAMNPAQAPAAAGAPQPAANLAMQSSVAAQPVFAAPKYEPVMDIPKHQPAASGPQRMQVLIRDNSIADTFRRKPTQDGEKDAPLLNATADDHEEFLREISTRNPTHRRPGISVKEEYERWLVARFRTRAAQGSRHQGMAAS
jgi:hypothetical protein